MNVKKKAPLDFRYNLKTYWSFLSKYKIAMIAVLVLIFINELANIGSNLLYKSVIDNGTKLSQGTLLKEAFIAVLISAVIIYCLLLFAKVTSKWLTVHLSNRLDAGLIWDLKRKFFNHIVNLSHNFHTTHKTGSLISRLGRGSSAAEKMTDSFVFNFIPTVFEIILVSISVAFFDRLSAVVIVATYVVFIVYGIWFQKLQNESRARANAAQDIEKANVGDVFTNFESVKYFGKENYIKNKFHKITENTKKAELVNWEYWKWISSGQSFILGLGTLLVLYFSLSKFLTGNMTLGTIVFIYATYGSLMGYMFGFIGGIRDFYRTMVDFNDLFQYAKIENEIKDPPNAKELKIHSGEINFDNISFNYRKRKIFENLKLKVKPNERIALVGHSGSGKSTLVKLLFRFYDVEKGRITIDGKDIRDFRQESVRGDMSVVPQECVLFDDTVYNNIIFSNPKASRKEVMQAIKSAQLDKIIKKFPYGEDTIVGERGIKLSGGEKQRVSIARAILADKKILVLDEATSSLDSETENEIQKDLFELMKSRTTLIIAHRLSTIMSADRIIVLKEGEIVQHGKHSDLISKPGEYRKLWRLQKGGYIK